MSVIEKGKILKSVRIELACGEFIKSLQEGESSLEFFEGDRFLGEEMKQKVYKEYCRMLKKSVEVKAEWWKFSSRSKYLNLNNPFYDIQQHLLVGKSVRCML